MVDDLHPFFAVERHLPAERDLLVAMFADYSWWHFQGNQGPVTTPAIPAAERLGEITAPPLVITGELDTQGIHFMADLTVWGIPSVQKVVMPGLDHVPFLADPAAFRKVVLAFLAAH